MLVPTHTRRALAAFALGIALLTLASTVGGFHLDDDVYRYEAAEVSYDGELEITDPETGQSVAAGGSSRAGYSEPHPAVAAVAPAARTARRVTPGGRSVTQRCPRRPGSAL